MLRRAIGGAGAGWLLLMAGGAVGAQTVVRTPVAGEAVKPLPPPGIAISPADRADLTAATDALGAEIAALRTSLASRPDLLKRLPDVQIYHNAVRYALQYNEFYSAAQVAQARVLLAHGRARAASLRDGSAPWTTQTGLVALGYVSRIDGSVQPYGLLVPDDWTAADTHPRRLDFFCHGRGETLNEIAFLTGRERSKGDFAPPGAFVLQPYGRYCNATRYAGEVDLFEALADAKSRYAIDDNRLVMRGFSMGGASAWQYATHHADKWVVAAPGAGFTETPEYSHALDPKNPYPPTWYERATWHWYDSVDYAENLYQCPVIAYNGDKDRQAQAADKMQEAMQKVGLPLTRVIGLNMGHGYTPLGKQQINEKIDPLVAKGRDTTPAHLHFTTWTLRYNTMDWLTVTGLGEHWQRARVVGELTGDTVTLTTENVSRLSLAPRVARKSVVIDGQTLAGLNFVRQNGVWSADTGADATRLRKKPGLQGPIDDAFMDRFVFVRPTGKPINPQTGVWVTGELARATREWRGLFRGEALVKDDREITDADGAAGTLVLWGRPVEQPGSGAYRRPPAGALGQGRDDPCTGQDVPGRHPCSRADLPQPPEPVALCGD